MPTEYSPSGGRSKSTLARSSASGTWVRMPAPSPELGSEPAAPRWSRLCSAVRPGGDDRARPASAGVGHEGDAAGVLVVRRVVEAGRRAGTAENGTAVRACRGRSGGGGEVGHVTPVVGGRPDLGARSRTGAGARAGGQRAAISKAALRRAGCRGTVRPGPARGSSPSGGDRRAVVRGATLARFRRWRPGQDRRRVCSEGYTAVTQAPHAQTSAPARRQDHVRSLAGRGLRERVSRGPRRR